MAYNNKRLSYTGKSDNQESILSSRQQVQELNPSGVSSRIQIRKQLSEQQHKPMVQPVSNVKRLHKPEHNDDYIGGFTNMSRNSTYHKARSLDNLSGLPKQDDDLEYL